MSRPSGTDEGPRSQPLPDPRQPAGTDLLPDIRHIVVLMMENHSYDSYLGMLEGRGDGLALGPDGRPTAANLRRSGEAVAEQHAPGPVQVAHSPTQSWNASHIQWNGGRCDGFVRSVEITRPKADATVPMRYWTEADLPFYYGLARTFPVADRWFCSCLGPTFPNRRFLIAGTAHELIDNLPFGLVDYPPAGTVFDLLNAPRIRPLTPLVPAPPVRPGPAQHPRRVSRRLLNVFKVTSRSHGRGRPARRRLERVQEGSATPREGS